MNFGEVLDRRPIIVAVAGSNGAGKTTFYESHLKVAGLRFVNADIIARQLDLDPYAAANAASAIRLELINQRESFVFETVFSDPVGEKIAFLKQAIDLGYTVVLCFIAISGWERSEERVAMRVSQGGHDVPTDKLISLVPRTQENLRKAIRELLYVAVLDNDNIATPFRRIAVFENGSISFKTKVVPVWLKSVLP